MQHHVGLLDAREQLLIGDAALGIVLHRVGEDNHAAQLIARPGNGLEIVQGGVDGAVQLGDGLLIGEGGEVLGELLGGDVLCRHFKAVAEHCQGEAGVLSAVFGQTGGEGENVLLKRGHGVGDVHQKQVRDGGPGLAHGFQPAQGGEGGRANPGLGLGDGLLVSGEIHIGVQATL